MRVGLARLHAPGRHRGQLRLGAGKGAHRRHAAAPGSAAQALHPRRQRAKTLVQRRHVIRVQQGQRALEGLGDAQQAALGLLGRDPPRGVQSLLKGLRPEQKMAGILVELEFLAQGRLVQAQPPEIDVLEGALTQSRRPGAGQQREPRGFLVDNAPPQQALGAGLQQRPGFDPPGGAGPLPALVPVLAQGHDHRARPGALAAAGAPGVIGGAHGAAQAAIGGEHRRARVQGRAEFGARMKKRLKRHARRSGL